MSYVFDCSAIFEAIKTNAIEVLAGNYTVELVRYELANIAWKEHVLYKRITGEELNWLIGLVKDVLGTMEVLGQNCHEKEILDVAKSLRVTFYDASYVFCAKSMKLPLVSEDISLTRAAKSIVQILKIGNIVTMS